MRNKPYAYYNNPEITGIFDMLKQRAEDHKGKIAFTFRKGRKEIQSKTFEEVYNDVLTLGHFLHDKYPQGSHISVIGENSYEWLIAFLSIVTSGNVAVPIDKELPKNEVNELISFADVVASFCSSTYMDLMESISDIDIYPSKQIFELVPESSQYQVPECKADSTACIFFTSGTSGNAKGVMLSHGNLTAEINNCCKVFKLEGNTLAVLPFHHVFSLMVGVLMVYNYGFNNFITKSVKQLSTDLMEAKPHTLFLVPLFIETFDHQIQNGIKKAGKENQFHMMIKLSDFLLSFGIDIRYKSFQEITKTFGGNLRCIVSGGAILDSLYIKHFRSLGIEIINGYGTTECSSGTAINRNNYHKDGTVGVLIAGASVNVADDGEILIKGPHVMQGYYKDSEGTAAALKDGWYHTGDLGNVDNDGFITLTGRKKNLIILSNGENISPEELESNISLNPGVREVLVYELQGKIIAEIFPADTYMDNQRYFNELIQRVNSGRPTYKQIAAVRLRNHDFIKNTNKKIIRYKNIPEA